MFIPRPLYSKLVSWKKVEYILNDSDSFSNSYLCFQDEEDVKAIARLFADMGDSYVELIATGIIK